jgi:hypothetical protein
LPAGLIPEAILERPLRVLLAEVDVDRSGSPASTSAYTRIVENRIRLSAVDQAFQCVDPGVAVAMPKLGECCRSERDLREWGYRSSMNRCSQRNAARS